MQTIHFTLILGGVAEVTPELADKLYEALGGDIEFNMRDGVAYLEIERQGVSWHEVVSQAISQVKDAGVCVVRVESEAANALAKINADLLMPLDR